jgi:hypothetical protein
MRGVEGALAPDREAIEARDQPDLFCHRAYSPEISLAPV